jgi:hypothetical protein
MLHMCFRVWHTDIMWQVKEILDQAGDKFLELSYEKIRNMIETDMGKKIEGDSQESLKTITAELYGKQLQQVAMRVENAASVPAPR